MNASARPSCYNREPVCELSCSSLTIFQATKRSRRFSASCTASPSTGI
ncbi:hypothetical protein BIW11_07504 [Tropilaelaps mercedesae]|uniref:Uncharacterized protein n=1 Tax=Tropilaelaps mercedesae TaxID=418985 RepID=A0A1V9XTW8_9ACAR|nr:hypothetical protein BIW11_07504 [Tropilaelaps mercedesae]